MNNINVYIISIVLLLFNKTIERATDYEQYKYEVVPITKPYRSSNYLFIVAKLNDTANKFVLDVNSNINWKYIPQLGEITPYAFYISHCSMPNGDLTEAELRIPEFTNPIGQISYQLIPQSKSKKTFMCPYCASLGFSYSYDDLSYSIMDQLSKFKYKKQFTIELNEEKRGTLTIGYNANNELRKCTRMTCNANTMINEKDKGIWGCALQGVLIGTNNTIMHLYTDKPNILEVNPAADNYYNTFSTTIAFETIQRLIIVSNHFFNYVTRVIFMDLINQRKCQVKIAKPVKVIVCLKNEVWNAPSVNFIFDDKLLSLTRRELFEEEDEYYDFFRIVTRVSENEGEGNKDFLEVNKPWIIGHLLLEKYELTFNMESQSVIIGPKPSSGPDLIKHIEFTKATHISDTFNVALIGIVKGMLFIIILIHLIGLGFLSIITFKLNYSLFK